MKFRISVLDVVIQMVFTAFFEWLVHDWTWTGFLERAGFVVPIALIAIATMRWAMGREEA